MKDILTVRWPRIITILFCIHMCLLVFNGTKYFTIGSRSQIYASIVILVACCMTLSCRGKKFKNIFSFERVICVLEILYTFVSAIFINDSFERGTFLASILFFTLIFFWTCMAFDGKDIRCLEVAHFFSGVILSLGIFFSMHRPYGLTSRTTILTYTGEYYDVNFLSALIVIPAILLFDKILRGEFNRMVAAVAFTLMVVAIILTGSRAAMGVLGLGIMMIIMSRKNIIDYLMIIPIILLLAYFLSLYIPDDIMYRFVNNGFDISKDRVRMLDWSYGIKLIAKNPVWGSGFVSSHQLIYDLLSADITAHNTYLVFVINYGILMTIPLLLVTLLPLYRLVKYDAPMGYIASYVAYLLLLLPIEANFSEIHIIPICLYLAISGYVKQCYLSKYTTC